MFETQRTLKEIFQKQFAGQRAVQSPKFRLKSFALQSMFVTSSETKLFSMQFSICVINLGFHFAISNRFA